MTSFDTNVDNYTIPELLGILDLDDPSTEQIMKTTNDYIERFSPERENQPNLVNFFQNIQTKLLRYMQQLETTGEDVQYNPNTKQTDMWYKYEALPQKNKVQKDKVTDRIQKIDVYDNNHVPMNREQLGVNNQFTVPVAQDTLNPNLENIISRFINIDSQFRQASGGTEAISTDYTLDLSDPLTDVLNLRLYSIQIPYTWYTIDYIYGNTCFWVTNPPNTFKIFVEPGNYTPSEFCVALQNAFTNSMYFNPPYTSEPPPPYEYPSYPQGFTYTPSPGNPPNIAVYNSNNGKITIYLDGWTDPAGNLINGVSTTSEVNPEKDPYFTFFDFTGAKTCYVSGSFPCGNSAKGQTFNNTLGWIMGFRIPLQPIYTASYGTSPNYVYSGGNTPISVLNLFGPKYFVLVIDDFNQNRINNGLITITELSKKLPLPSYFNPSQPYVCTPIGITPPELLNLNAISTYANNNGQTAASLGVNPANFFNSLQDKIDVNGGGYPQVLPSAPRTLTQAQIYSINEIIKNRSKTISYRSKAPTNSDTFALIPIKYSGMSTGDYYVDFSGSLQDNKRIYFGPVDIDRLRIRLYDDKGNIVDLHGGDWCITLISENLYQY